MMKICAFIDSTMIRAKKLEREKKESRMFDKLQRLVSEGVELSG